jgi:tripeptide aminopeptidase
MVVAAAHAATVVHDSSQSPWRVSEPAGHRSLANLILGDLSKPDIPSTCQRHGALPLIKAIPRPPRVSPEPDLARALDLVLQLMRVAGASCREAQVIDFVRQKLLAAGAPPDAVFTDDAHLRSPAGGESGNLILKLRGTRRGPRRLLMAHIDTVPLCVGSQPHQQGSYIETANPLAGLGADNRSGVGVILTAALEILERRLPHPPLTFLFTVQEELGMYGARFCNPKQLGHPKLAWNWDGRGPHRITLAATGGHTIDIKVHGIASHAGGAPECGVSAIAIAASAIHQLVQAGWHGDIQRGRQHGTCNLGMIKGGDATNVVTDFVQIHGECRSFQPALRERIVRKIRQAFDAAASSIRNEEGQAGRVETQAILEYEAFQLSQAHASVTTAQAVIESIGLTPELLTTNSALDANWMNFHGIPTATLGAGQIWGHSTRECMDVEQYEQACRIALRLASEKDESPVR